MATSATSRQTRQHAHRRLRRLRTVATALSAAGPVAFVEHEDPDTALALEHPLAQRVDGQVEGHELERLRLREAEAVEARQYRLATQLRDLQECLDPRNQLTLEKCCPPTLETQYQYFLRQGFVVLPDAIDATLLREIQEAWTRVVEPVQKQWAEDIQQGEGIDGLFFKKPPASSIAAPTTRGPVLYRTFFDIPNFLEQDDAFLNLIDRPKVVALLERLVGLGGVTTEERTPQQSPYHGVASVGGFQARTVPSENNEEGYISWHRDKPPADH